MKITEVVRGRLRCGRNGSLGPSLRQTIGELGSYGLIVLLLSCSCDTSRTSGAVPEVEDSGGCPGTACGRNRFLGPSLRQTIDELGSYGLIVLLLSCSCNTSRKSGAVPEVQDSGGCTGTACGRNGSLPSLRQSLGDGDQELGDVELGSYSCMD